MNAISNGIIGDDLNYFTLDLILMLLKWNCKDLTSDDQFRLQKLFEYVLPRTYNIKSNLFKYNLEILKSIIELWKSYITPTEFIVTFLSEHNTDQLLIDLQIQTSIYLLKNNTQLWMNDNQKKKYLDNIIKYVYNSNVNIYLNSTELIGSLIKIMNVTDDNNELTQQIIKIIEHSKDKNTFYNKLYAIHKHCPQLIDAQIVDQLINIEINQSTITTPFTIKLLKVIAACWPLCYSNVKIKYKINLITCLNHSDVDIQLNTLQVFDAISTVADQLTLNEYFTSIGSFVKHPNVNCRQAMFSFMKNIYQRVINNEMLLECKQILLLGLGDRDENIRKNLYHFWYTQNNHNSIFVFILNLYDLFTIETETDFLIQYLWCLLEYSIDSEQCKEKMFNTPLVDCNFTDYKIMVKNYVENASLTPLFINSSYFDRSSSTTHNTLQILATNQENDLKSVENSNWGTSIEVSHSSQTVHNDSTNRKRFLINQNRANRKDVLEIHNRKYTMEKRRQERQKQKYLNVSVHRKYRKGDFPDIEIANEDFIKPLQILIQQDTVIAKLLFVSLFNGIIQNLSPEAIDFLETINNKNIFSNILQNMNLYMPSMVGALFELTLKYKNYINLSPELITNASKQSGLLSLGCLLLEESLITGFDDEEPPAKKSSNCCTLETDYWLKLSDLYKTMAETYYVYGILGEKINNNDLYEAFNYELNNKWYNARDIYLNKIGNLTKKESIIIRDFYYDSYFNCFAKLSEWNCDKGLVENLEKLTSFDEVWEDDWKQEQILPWIIKTQMHNVCYDQQNKEFLKKLSEWLQDKNKRQYLERNFCEYLILFSIYGNNYQKAKCYVTLFEQLFVNDWMDISNRHSLLKALKLDQLQVFYDIKTFLHTHENINTGNQESLIKNLNIKWNNIIEFQSLDHCESTLWYRHMFTKKILAEINQNNVNLPGLLYETIATISIDIMNYALNNMNCAVSRKYNMFTKNILKQSNVSISKSILLKYELAKSRLYQLNNIGKRDQAVLLESLNKSWSILSNTALNDHIELKIQCYQQKYEFLIQLSSLNFPSEVNQKILNDYNSTMNIPEMALKSLLDAESLCSEQCEQNKNNQKYKYTLINVYLKIANYCRTLVNVNDNYIEQLIKSILKCMQLGSNEAVQLFPCLLLNCETYTPKQQEYFMEEASNVPTWMFLNWIPQLLSAMNKSGSKMLNEILLRISTTYPKAMCYIYPISRENFSDVSKNDELISRLDKLFLNNDDMNTFLQALLNVNIPEVILTYHLKKILTALRKFKNQNEELLKAYQNMKKDCFSDKRYANGITLFGPVFDDIAEYETKVDNLLNTDKESVDIDQELVAMINQLQQIIQAKKINELNKKLSYYSPWLAKLQKLQLNERIEIPGQYTSNRQPLTQYHVHIISIKQHVSIIPSLRRPIKITIVGSDAKEYPYLIKFGEDLRQDQRIQQLFSLINSFLQKNKDVTKLAINTYKIEPLNDRLGIIEWLNDTESLHEFGFKTNEQRHILSDMRRKYKTWILSVSKEKLSEPEAYAVASTHYTKNSVLQKYNEIKYMLPWNLFRTAFINLTSTFEDFFFIRHEFIKSYAAQAVAQWILGVGDRHLSNILISLKSGQVIGIDFGYAFGIGTQILSIPELVPFRLTSQILNVIKPFEESGLLKLCMIKTLRSIRENQDVLLSLMNVFIHEPTTEWLEIANSKFDENNANPIDWYPTKKIKLTKDKLEGANPVTITLDELNDNYNIRNKKGYIDCLNLVAGFNSENQSNLTVEKQVECLLNQAMDPNLLGRMYCNWDPFV